MFDFLLQEPPCRTRLFSRLWGRHLVSTFFHISGEYRQHSCWDKLRGRTHLIQTKESQVPQHTQSADPGSCSDLSRYLQANLHYLQRVGEDDLRAAGLRGREDRQKQISKSEPNWHCKEEKSRKASTLYHFMSPSSQGNERTMLWPVHEDGLKLSWSQSTSGFVSAWDVKSVSQTGLSRVSPAIFKMAKLINSFGKQKWSQMWQLGAPNEKERDACYLLRVEAKIRIYSGLVPRLSKHSLYLAQPPAQTSLGWRTINTTLPLGGALNQRRKSPLVQILRCIILSKNYIVTPTQK